VILRGPLTASKQRSEPRAHHPADGTLLLPCQARMISGLDVRSTEFNRF
jgi:hypothetical protein